MPEQAAFDVQFYDLDLEVFPETQRIAGTLTVQARVEQPLRQLVLDLDTLLKVSQVKAGAQTLTMERKTGTLWIDLGRTYPPGETVEVAVSYAGSPMKAPIRHGTWSDGFHWDTTAAGAPWLSIVSVLNGADIWWPCKDHPSDEPDSMALHITVPNLFTVAANGQLRSVEAVGDNKKRFHWFVSTPINNYDVTINVAPYVELRDQYLSTSGDTIPVFFWVLPEHESQGRKLLPQFSEHLHFFEKHLGPYPFRTDKYGVAETSFYGMENQSIISYGAPFRDNEYGFDLLHFHELAHEWWANQITAPDWKDWWIHESLATYLEAIYVEDLHGLRAYHTYMGKKRRGIRNRLPVAPTSPQTSREIYNGDIYSKGAWILHTMRYLMGRDKLLETFRKITYPTPEAEKIQDGTHCRFVTTDGFREALEAVSGQELQWLFDVYFHQPVLPQLKVERQPQSLKLCWEVPDERPFPMPVEVRINGKIRVLFMETPCQEIPLSGEERVEVDPWNWILKKEGDTD